MKEEVFAERCTRFRSQDVCDYVLQGGPITERVRTERVLYRLRVTPDLSGVLYEPLAYFHARIIAKETNERGRVIAVIVGRNRSGTPFLFRCPLDYLTSGRAIGGKRFLRAFCNAQGTLPSFVIPGRLAATLRAIVSLSDEGEPIPHSSDEMACL